MAALGGSVARRYARALFQIGVDKGNFEALGQEVEDLANLYSSSAELRQTLESPVFPMGDKRAVLEAALPRVAPSKLLHDFILLLLERRRLPALPLIARAFQEMVDAQLGRVRAVITSAKPLDVMVATEVQRALEKRTGKKVLVRTEVDPELLAGVVARVGDLVLDGSLRTRLENMHTRILPN